MAYNFLAVEGDQVHLLPPSVADWLPEDHLAWFVLDAVNEMDLTPFYAGYRTDDRGAAAHDPKMMVALNLYAYCLGIRSSRQIERACHVDLGCKVVAANQCPDHTTIAPTKPPWPRWSPPHCDCAPRRGWLGHGDALR